MHFFSSNFQWFCLTFTDQRLFPVNCSMLSPICQIAFKLSSKQCIKLLILNQRCENALYGQCIWLVFFICRLNPFRLFYFLLLLQLLLFGKMDTHTHTYYIAPADQSIELIYWRCMSIDLAAEILLSVSSWLIRIAHLKFGHDWRFRHKMHLRSNGFECFQNRCAKSKHEILDWMDKRHAHDGNSFKRARYSATILNCSRDKAIVTDCCQIILETKWK